MLRDVGALAQAGHQVLLSLANILLLRAMIQTKADAARRGGGQTQGRVLSPERTADSRLKPGGTPKGAAGAGGQI